MRVSLFLAALVFLPLSTTASADELTDLRERVSQLEATVEELTLQLADSVRERRQLETELAEAVATAGTAVAAPSAGPSASAVSAETPPAVADEETIEETAITPVAASRTQASGAQAAASEPVAASALATPDCDVAQALSGYDGKRRGNEALETWLQTDDHLKRCSTAQLQELRKAVKWDWLGYEKPVLKLLDQELARR